MKQTWENPEKIKALAVDYTNITVFIKQHPGAWRAAKRFGITEEIKAHMKAEKRRAYTKEEIREKALACGSRAELRSKNRSIYNAARKLDILDEICFHMPEPKTKAYTGQELCELALSCKDRKEFKKKYPGAHTVACDRGILDRICVHMPEATNKAKTHDYLKNKAALYEYRADFEEYDGSAYNIAIRHGILDEICSHMQVKGGTSVMERQLFNIIKKVYPSAKKLRIRKINIKERLYIKGFEIDIFIPELGLGIEFDGDYHHSFEKMREDEKKNWPDEAILNYHKIKDDYFLHFKNIKILHIKEKDWKENKQACIDKCLEFLGV